VEKMCARHLMTDGVLMSQPYGNAPIADLQPVPIAVIPGGNAPIRPSDHPGAAVVAD
jgi:hypothetical protein